MFLPDGLRLWALAGGRPDPSPDPSPGAPDELGGLLEAATELGDRRALGAHYTPVPLANGVAERALAGHDFPQVGDPACGGGALLLAAARLLAARGEPAVDVVARLWGADVDAVAVATTEVALTLWAGVAPPAEQLIVADVLTTSLPWPPLDAIVGNPPFLSQLGQGTARGAEESAALRVRFGGAVRAYTDTSSLFLLLGCDLVHPGGTVAMVQPQSVLGARDAAGVRERLADRADLREVWVPGDPGFAASVDVCIPVLDVGATDEPSRRDRAGHGWSVHLARANGVPAVGLDARRTLGDEAETTAAFRDEYYGLAAVVHEQADRPDGAPLVTTGLIELGRSAWGQRPARIAHRRWSAPVIDVGALEGRAAVWVARTRAPKLVVATQTRVVEVAVDESGTWVAGVPLIVVLAPPDRLWPLAAAVASPPVTAWVAARTAGTALTASALKLTAALVREVPLPADAVAWAAGADALRAGDLQRFAEAMTAAYDCDHDVLAWWQERAKLTWPLAEVVR